MVRMHKVDEELLQEVLSLPSDQRTFLIEKLLESLNTVQTPEIDALWKDEIERRVSEIESGDVKLINGEEVFQKIRKRLEK